MIIFSRILNAKKEVAKKPSLVLLIRTIISLFVLMIIYCLGSKYFENNTWQEAIWQTWQTFTTVGYGNKAAETVLGQWHSIIFATLGIAVLGLTISRIADYRQEKRERRKYGMVDKNPVKNGVIIFNFPGEEQLQILVRELRHIEPKIGFCIIDERLEKLPSRVRQLGGMEFISGGMLDCSTYRRANISENKYVYVFPSEPGVSRSDALTVNILKKVESYTLDKHSVIYIQVDPTNDDVFAGCKGRSIDEALEILALVQETTDKYTSVLIEDLIKNTSGANPLTVGPKKVVGWSWYQFQKAVFDTGYREGIKINLLGIIKDGKVQSCPEFNTIIEKGDLISVIVDNNFKWGEFEKKIKI